MVNITIATLVTLFAVLLAVGLAYFKKTAASILVFILAGILFGATSWGQSFLNWMTDLFDLNSSSNQIVIVTLSVLSVTLFLMYRNAAPGKDGKSKGTGLTPVTIVGLLVTGVLFGVSEIGQTILGVVFDLAGAAAIA